MKRQVFLLSGAGAVLAGCAGASISPGMQSGPGAQPEARAGGPETTSADDALLGSIALFPYTFTPTGYARCDGKFMNISTNNALASLIWTRFGGNGVTTFGLPDMRGREPIQDLSYNIATRGRFPSRKGLTQHKLTPLAGEILLVPYLEQFIPPKGWSACDGKLLPVSGNEVIYNLLGSRFGGNGTTDFALPDLRNHVPLKGLTYIIALNGVYPRSA
jgi:microcystin-dependent protein